MSNSSNLSEFDINSHEKKFYSQNGEDGILEFIFSVIDTTNKYSVEFGVGNGTQCNTIYLQEKKGWNGLMMDYSPDPANTSGSDANKAWYKNIKRIFNRKTRSPNLHLDIKNEKVTADNIQQLFQKYQVPKQFDLLSIDIDFNDYWVWKSIVDYVPRVVVIEFNAAISPNESRVVAYDPEAHWDGTNYFGASLLALQKLGLEKGYTLVGCDDKGVNAFFCQSDLVKEFKTRDIQQLYRPPKYGEIVNGRHIGHPLSEKTMMEI